VAPTVGRVDANLAYLLRPGLLSDVVQDQIPEFQIVVNGIEFELAILKPDSPRSLLARGVESVEIGLSEWHLKVLLDSFQQDRREVWLNLSDQFISRNGATAHKDCFRVGVHHCQLNPLRLCGGGNIGVAN